MGEVRKRLLFIPITISVICFFIITFQDIRKKPSRESDFNFALPEAWTYESNSLYATQVDQHSTGQRSIDKQLDKSTREKFDTVECGLINGERYQVSDSSLTSSRPSEYKSYQGYIEQPSYCFRLQDTVYKDCILIGWRGYDSKDGPVIPAWIQVDFLEQYVVIATATRGLDVFTWEYVTHYKLSSCSKPKCQQLLRYPNHNEPLIFLANENPYYIVKRYLDPAIVGSVIRLEVVKFEQNPSLQWEVYTPCF